MRWNCQKDDWPHFAYQAEVFREFENDFLALSGQVLGAFEHLSREILTL